MDSGREHSPTPRNFLSAGDTCTARLSAPPAFLAPAAADIAQWFQSLDSLPEPYLLTPKESSPLDQPIQGTPQNNVANGRAGRDKTEDVCKEWPNWKPTAIATLQRTQTCTRGCGIRVTNTCAGSSSGWHGRRTVAPRS
jgi:hypothetical protein